MITVFSNATVIPSTADGAVIENGRVVVEDGVIVEVGVSTGAIPAGATEVDGTGTTIIPGLHNLHDHMSRKALRSVSKSAGFRSQSDNLMREPAEYLAYHAAANLRQQLGSGVTTIRDFGLPGAGGIQAMRAIDNGVIPGPRLIAGGDPICITGGHSSVWGAMEADGPVGVVRAVRAQIGRGAAVIKFMGSGGLGTYPDEEPGIPEFTIEELTAGVAEAHKFHRRTATHAYSTEAITNAVVAGSGTIEHGTFMDDQVISLMLEHGTAYVPTLSSVAGIAWKHRLAGDDYLYNRISDEIIGRHMDSVRMAWAAGVPIGTGTDSSGEVVEELELIAEATGASLLEVLASATRTAASIAGLTDTTGTLTPGLAAELVVVDGDLLTEGFEALRRPRWVMRAGELHPGAPMPLGVRLSQMRGLI
jgi:imidazolonepropionase-like amidohydrolase